MKYYILKINNDSIECLPLVEHSNVEPVILPKGEYKIIDFLVGEYDANIDDLCGMARDLRVNDIIEIE